jgi:hypothetical protein
MPAAARLCLEGTFGAYLSLPSNRAADLRREAVAAIADPGHGKTWCGEFAKLAIPVLIRSSGP